jgi:signal transduction histidine kinase
MTQLAETYRLRDPDTSFYYGKKALELSRRAEYPTGETKALLSLSHYFTNRGNLTEGLELGLKGLAVAQKHNLRYDQAFAMIRIGNVYMYLKDYHEALKYFHQTRQLTKNSPDSFFYAVTFWRAADAYDKLNMIDSALLFAKMAEDTARGMGNNLILRGIAPILGNSYARKGNDELALRYYHKYQGVSSVNLAAFFKDRGMTDSAIYYAKRAYEFSLKNATKDMELNAATLLSSLYETNDPLTALHFLKIAVAAKDSLHSSEKVMSVKSVAFKEQERQNEIQRKQMAYRSNVKIYASLAGLVVLIFIASLLFRNNRNQRKANALLQQQKNEIARTLSDLRTTQTQLIQSEKMASLGELTAGIAHEIQNPLNFVNNFSEVNIELLDELENAILKSDREEILTIRSDLKQNLEKISHHGKRADAIVKGMLQHSRASTGTKETTDINKLADEYLRLSYHGLRAKDKLFNAAIETHFEEGLQKVSVIPQDIGRVLLNLFTNAFYAVAEKNKNRDESYKPTVSVSTRTVGGNVEISVKDNGMGIPQHVLDKIYQPFFTTKPTGQGTGLGLSMSYDIIKAHGGELKVETREGEGAEFIILLPV